MTIVGLLEDARAELGEGPVWDERTDELPWVDIMAGVVHRLDPDSGADRPLAVGQPVGAVAPRATGGYVIAARDGIAALSDSGEVTFIAEIETELPTRRFNDGKCDPLGRLWAGTIKFAGRAQPSGTLYRVETDHSFAPVVTGVKLSNGLGWSPDGSAMYFIDSLAGALDVFDYHVPSGRVTARRRVVTFPAADGSPDGLTVDSEGFIWVALYGGGAVRRYSPGGELALVVELPVSQPTSCTFGGDGLRNLYITSARQELSPAQLVAEPSAGGVFRCRPGPVGLPANVFAG